MLIHSYKYIKNFYQRYGIKLRMRSVLILQGGSLEVKISTEFFETQQESTAWTKLISQKLTSLHCLAFVIHINFFNHIAATNQVKKNSNKFEVHFELI